MPGGLSIPWLADSPSCGQVSAIACTLVLFDAVRGPLQLSSIFTAVVRRVALGVVWRLWRGSRPFSVDVRRIIMDRRNLLAFESFAPSQYPDSPKQQVPSSVAERYAWAPVSLATASIKSTRRFLDPETAYTTTVPRSRCPACTAFLPSLASNATGVGSSGYCFAWVWRVAVRFLCRLIADYSSQFRPFSKQLDVRSCSRWTKAFPPSLSHQITN